jgi:CHC2 zinc finger
MISLPSWTELYSRMGEPTPRRTRARCLIHGGDSLTSVSLDHKRGLYYCHVCGAGGDRVDWVMRVLGTDFHGALAWLGIRSGKPPAPDPAAVRRVRTRAGLRRWADALARELRYEHYVMERVAALAEDRLRQDPEDRLAWNWLAWTAKQEEIAHILDLLDGTEAEQLQVYREMRTRWKESPTTFLQT